MGGLNIKDVLLDEVMRTVRNQIEKPLQALEIENPIAYNFLSSRHQLCKHDACLIMLYHIQNDFEFELLIVGYNKTKAKRATPKAQVPKDPRAQRPKKAA